MYDKCESYFKKRKLCEKNSLFKRERNLKERRNEVAIMWLSKVRKRLRQFIAIRLIH